MTADTRTAAGRHTAALAAPLDTEPDVTHLRAVVASACRRFPVMADFAAHLGNTPLVDLPTPTGGARIVAKLESANPAGSVKDRVAFAMLADRLARPEALGHVLEYSGGNLAVSLSRLCHGLGAPLTLVLSSGSPPSLLTTLATEGTDVRLVDQARGFRAVIEEAIALADAGTYSFLFQHRAPVNIAVHESTTGSELLAQLGHAPHAWVASIGTGGTLVGVARALRNVDPSVQVVGVTPAEMPYGTPLRPDPRPRYAGSGGLGDGVRQPFVEADTTLVAGHEHVAYPDALAAMATLLRETGLRVGSSAAANWLAARRVARTLGEGRTVATVLPCAGTPEEWKKVTAP